MVKVEAATCRSIGRARKGHQPAGRDRRDGDLRPARIHQGRHAAPCQARRLRDRAGLLFPLGRDLTKITEMPKLMPIVNPSPMPSCWPISTRPWHGQSRRTATPTLGIIGFCRGGRTVWEYAAHNKGLKAGVAFYGSLVDPAAQKEGEVAEEPDPTCARDEGAGARPLR